MHRNNVFVADFCLREPGHFIPVFFSSLGGSVCVLGWVSVCVLERALGPRGPIVLILGTICIKQGTIQYTTSTHIDNLWDRVQK